jgi:hypothetical protein
MALLPSQVTLCLIQELGPTQFVVKGMGDTPEDQLKFKVKLCVYEKCMCQKKRVRRDGTKIYELIVYHPVLPTIFQTCTRMQVQVGSQQKCTCQKKRAEETCVHILFVMLKVLRLAADNPMVLHA